MCAPLIPSMTIHFDSFERNEQFVSITPGFHQELSCGLLQLRLILSCGWLEFRKVNKGSDWFYPVANWSSAGSIRVAAVSCPGGWIQVTAESSSSGCIKVTVTRVPGAGCELRLTQVLAAGYELRLTYTLIHQVNLRAYSAKYKV